MAQMQSSLPAKSLSPPRFSLNPALRAASCCGVRCFVHPLPLHRLQAAAQRRRLSARGQIMYRFLEGTADQYMTRVVTTVTRQTTMHELGALFQERDFNSFPVMEEGKMLGIVTKFDFRTFAFTTGQMVPHYRNDD